MQVVCFHNPDEDYGFLSNWHLSVFSADGITFSSMEQFMMYKKALCFGDDKTAARILNTPEVSEIKALGRMVAGYDDNIWSGIRQIVVYQGLMEKFTQNDELKARLLKTGNSVFAECAVKDTIWGIGLSIKDPDRFEIAKWKGQNLLGYTLTMVREVIKNTPHLYAENNAPGGRVK